MTKRKQTPIDDIYHAIIRHAREKRINSAKDRR